MPYFVRTRARAVPNELFSFHFFSVERERERETDRQTERGREEIEVRHRKKKFENKIENKNLPESKKKQKKKRPARLERGGLESRRGERERESFIAIPHSTAPRKRLEPARWSTLPAAGVPFGRNKPAHTHTHTHTHTHRHRHKERETR